MLEFKDKCHSYCCSGTRKVWFLIAFPKDNRVSLTGYLPDVEFEYFAIQLFHVASYCSCSRKVWLLCTFPENNKRSDTLSGYLPKLEFKYFDTSCPETYNSSNKMKLLLTTT